MGAALQRLIEEDPSVRVERQAETGEQLLWAQGENHIAVIVERLKRKFGAAVVTQAAAHPLSRDDPRPRRRQRAGTRSRPAAAASSATSGSRSSPTPAAAWSSQTKVVGGSVPRQFWAGVEKGVRDVAEKGPHRRLSRDRLQGNAVRRLVPHRRLGRAVVPPRRPAGDAQGHPGVEPGAARADHGRRGARPRGVHGRREPRPQHAPRPRAGHGHRQMVCRSCERTCRRPSCSPTRRSCARLTGGRGVFTASLDHYEEVPAHVAQKIIEAHKKEEAAAHS